jgi:hypothetical protein
MLENRNVIRIMHRKCIPPRKTRIPIKDINIQPVPLAALVNLGDELDFTLFINNYNSPSSVIRFYLKILVKMSPYMFRPCLTDIIRGFFL